MTATRPGRKTQGALPPEGTEIFTGYVPRKLQYELHRNLKRFNVLVCHRRFGKTIFSINHLIDRALRNKLPMPRYAYIAPTYGQAKRVVWDQLKHYTAKIPGVVVNEGELRVDFPSNGARIMLLSAENPSSLKGIYLDGVILDEYAIMPAETWTEVIRPTLNDRKGFAVFISTPKGENDFYDRYVYATQGKDGVKDPEWFGALYKASETKIIDADELASARRTMAEEEYEQEYECSFTAALVGAYFGKQLAAAERDKRIGAFPYDPALAVDTYWDLGINDMTAIWFVQSSRGRHTCIDYYETAGSDIASVMAEVQRRMVGKVFGRIVLPHDAKQRDSKTGKSFVDYMYSLKFRNITVVPRPATKIESINAARVIMATTSFDREACKQGLKMLAQYQQKWNSKNSVYEDAPLHNAASNGADAFQCFALGAREGSGAGEDFLAKNQRAGGVLQAETEYDPLAYGGVGVH